MKTSNKNKIEATIFPVSGRPRVVEVEPDDDNRFSVGELSWEISAGSTWEHRGRVRVLCHEGIPFTLNADIIAGDSPATAKHLHQVASDNLMEQVWKFGTEKPWYGQAQTWLLVGAILLIALMAFWMVQVVGSGFEGLEDTLSKANFGAGKTAAEAGHNEIGSR